MSIKSLLLNLFLMLVLALSICDSEEDVGDDQTMYKSTQSESEFEIDTEAEEALSSDLDNEQ